MSDTSGAYRIYKCPSCMNIGYVKVETDGTESLCSLCGTLQASENEIVYASTVLEAEEYVRKLALESKSRSKSKKPQRGLGVRRRIINIIDALVDLNRGRPVAIVKVIQEAAEAGITLSKTSRVLYDLIDSGAVIEIEDGVTIGHEDEHS